MGGLNTFRAAETGAKQSLEGLLEDGQAPGERFLGAAHGIGDVGVAEAGVLAQEADARGELGELLGEVLGVRPLHDEDEIGAAQRVPRGEARLVREGCDAFGQEEAARGGGHLVPGLRRDPA